MPRNRGPAECLAFADRRDHRRRDHRLDAGYRHDVGAVLFGAADLFDFARNILDPFVQPEPVAIEPDQDAAHPGRYLIPSLFEDRLEGILQPPQPRPYSDARFDQEGPDLVDGGRAPRNRACPDPVQGLKVELLLVLLRDGPEVRPQRGLRVVVIVFLALVERLDVNRRDDPRLEPHARSVRPTKWALRQASIPTMQRGSPSKVAFRAKRLICLRMTSRPVWSNPTR